jgi:hypothetical protein
MENNMTSINDGTNNKNYNESASLRERFILDYSVKKGWDPKQLTTQQMLEITNHPGYKKAGLVLG